MSKTTRGWLPRRCKCPRCSGLAITPALRRALKEHLEHLHLEQPRAPEQPLLDQLLRAGGLIRRNATKEK